MSTLPPCPQCHCEYTYEDGGLLICPECAHEWAPEAAPAPQQARVWKDAHGNVLQDGDAVTLVKTAREFVRRSEQQLHATLHQQIELAQDDGQRLRVTLDIEPDDEHPSALLRAWDAAGALLAEARVAPSFKLTRASAGTWAESGFGVQAVRR